jgi:hypothetical protein
MVDEQDGFLDSREKREEVMTGHAIHLPRGVSSA